MSRWLGGALTVVLAVGTLSGTGYAAVAVHPFADPGPEKPVTVFALTDWAGDVTDVATAGLEELTEAAAAEPTSPELESTEPAAPTPEPTESSDPAPTLEPSEQGPGTAEPSEQAGEPEPTEPTDPSQPADPSQASDSVDPGNPAEPSQPTDPASGDDSQAVAPTASATSYTPGPGLSAGTLAAAVDGDSPELEDLAVLSPPMAVDEFMVAGLTWDGTLPADAAVFLRVLEGETWTDWLPLEVEVGGPDGTSAQGTEPFVAGGGTAIQVQITGAAATLPANLKLTVVPGNPANTEVEVDTPTEAPEVLPESDPVVPDDVVEAAQTQSASFKAPALIDSVDEWSEDASAPMFKASTLIDAENDAMAANSIPAIATTTSSFQSTGFVPTVAGYSAPTDPDLMTYSEAVAAASALPTYTPPRPPNIINRTMWGADPDLMRWTPSYADLKATVVHHTAGSNNYTAEQSPAIVRAIYYYHSVTKGWGDIGYNFLVDKYGQIFEGRVNSINSPNGSMVVGGHARPTNTGTIGISAIGTYYDGIMAPQIILDKMIEVISWKYTLGVVDMSQLSGIISPGTSTTPKGINLPRIYGHKDVAATACPGEMYPLMGWMNNQVKAKIPANHRPFGNVDSFKVTPTSLTVSGWVLDANTTAPVSTTVLIDGKPRTIDASKSRPDIGAAFGMGDKHGFQETIPLSPGQHTVCMKMADDLTGTQFTLMSCRVVNANQNPFGNVDSVSVSGSTLKVSGWALDPDTTASIDVQIYVNSTLSGVVKADQSRPDIQAAFGLGDKHGFTYTTTLTAGKHTVCVNAVNRPAGTNPRIGACTDVTVAPSQANRTPFGNVDFIGVTGSTLNVSGWAIDPDTRSPIDVHVYVDSRLSAVVKADVTRPDLDAAFGLGAKHGFTYSRNLTVGQHLVCVYAINTPSGTNPVLGECRNVHVSAPGVNPQPIGNIDHLSVTGSKLNVSGWALDYDSNYPIDVHVYVNWSLVSVVKANQSRPDIAAAFGMGDKHGFSYSQNLPVGNHLVCVFGINTPTGTNPVIGSCQNVTVATPQSRLPVGNIDSVTVSGATVKVSGWTVDPDTSNSLDVHVYVDGRYANAIKANQYRPDVDAVYGLGPNHGFTYTTTLTSGTHSICAFAINQPTGTNPVIAQCQVVTIR